MNKPFPTPDTTLPASPLPPPDPEEPAAKGAETDLPAYDPARRATELAIIEALRGVMDPELGMDVIELALIKEIIIGKDSSEIRMVLTTPFCPYAGSLIAQIREGAEEVLAHPVEVTLLAQAWDPREAGLIW